MQYRSPATHYRSPIGVQFASLGEDRRWLNRSSLSASEWNRCKCTIDRMLVTRNWLATPAHAVSLTGRVRIDGFANGRMSICSMTVCGPKRADDVGDQLGLPTCACLVEDGGELVAGRVARQARISCVVGERTAGNECGG